jgi:hypothetical protein
MKTHSCYTSGEGFYSLLQDTNNYIFLNTVFPCSIKDLYKVFVGYKQYNLKVCSVKSFIKLSALRDNSLFLSLFYPRGFVLKLSLEELQNKDKMDSILVELKQVGEAVAIKYQKNILLTINYWGSFLYYGKYKNYYIIVIILLFILTFLLNRVTTILFTNLNLILTNYDNS